MTRLMPGGPVPDLEVALAGGGTWKLSDQKPETFTVVEVYRGLHCPRCKLQLLDMDHKVARYAERVHHPDRLTTPLLKQAGGGFAPIGWDDALDLVAEKFTQATQALGSEAVWPYYYAGTMGKVQRDGINTKVTHIHLDCLQNQDSAAPAESSAEASPTPILSDHGGLLLARSG